MTHKTKTPLALAIGTAFAASLATSSIANAAPSATAKGFNVVFCDIRCSLHVGFEKQELLLLSVTVVRHDQLVCQPLRH